MKVCRLTDSGLRVSPARSGSSCFRVTAGVVVSESTGADLRLVGTSVVMVAARLSGAGAPPLERLLRAAGMVTGVF